ncbi:zinc finger protein 260-like isoform X2 [Diachasmimorpha longicaudata]|uniref:zinc finger protein 260-like isoform X2 n=1 Tax=Diachasmimorpha longicaudata TaxID=58733 RepID=UPI0030B8C827
MKRKFRNGQCEKSQEIVERNGSLEIFLMINTKSNDNTMTTHRTMEENFVSGVLKEEPDRLLPTTYIEDICASTFEKVFLPLETHEVDFPNEMVKLDLEGPNSHHSWVSQIASTSSSFKLHMNHEIAPKSKENTNQEDEQDKRARGEQEEPETLKKIETRSKLSKKFRITVPATNIEEALTHEGYPSISHTSKFCKIQCSLCNKWFLNNESMIAHLRSHSSSFICQICQEMFPNDHTLDSHMLKHLETKISTATIASSSPLECGICNKEFSLKNCLRNHLQAHLTQSLTNHCACQHDQHLQEDNDKPSTLLSSPCKLCEENCEEEAPGRSKKLDFREDKKNIKNKSQTVLKLKPFRCALCPRSFAQRTPLKNHILTHSEERPFACRICEKTYKRNSELIRHTMVHTGERPYECKECLMTFREKTKLNSHMVVHTGEKPFECHICHKFLARKSDLTSHMLSHTGGQYDCKICEKIFTRKSDLNRHLLVHTGEKPFACDFCDMAFREKTRLNTHLVMHTGDKRHACRICEKRFKDKLGLRKHMIGHAGERPYVCFICKKRFKMKSTLVSHMQVHEVDVEEEYTKGENFEGEGVLRKHILGLAGAKQRTKVKSEGDEFAAMEQGNG